MARRSRPTQTAAQPTPAPAAPKVERATRRRRLSTRSYEGADGGRLLGDWNPSASSANSEVYFDLARLRNRSRDLLRNNPLAVNGIQSLVTSIVGTGIHPQPATGDAALDARIAERWNQWASGELDVSHDRTWASLQALWVRAWLESGSVLVRKRTRRLSDGYAAPLQLQTLEADFVDLMKTEALGDSAHITMGVEFDAIGRRVAYWLYRQHPGETLPMLSVPTYDSQRVSADDVAYLTMIERPGQVHGIPWLTPAMDMLYHLRQLDRYKLAKAQTEAAFAAFVVPGDESYSSDGDQEGAAASVEDADGRTIDRIEPGLISILRGGKDVRFAQPTASADFPQLVQLYQRLVAAGMRITYERLTRDYSGVNYSSYRAGDLEMRRMVTMLQRDIVIPLLCRPVWRWFCEALSIVDPSIPANVKVRWHCPRHEELDAEKELKARILAVQNGFAAPSMVTAEQGLDFDDVLSAYKADMERAQSLGLPLQWLGDTAPAPETPQENPA